MSTRFHFPLDPPAIGERVIEKMNVLKIELIKITDDDGDVQIMADYRIEGCIDVAAGDLSLVKALLGEFAKPQEGGCCHG